jgi:hypothetical protein
LKQAGRAGGTPLARSTIDERLDATKDDVSAASALAVASFSG